MLLYIIVYVEVQGSVPINDKNLSYIYINIGGRPYLDKGHSKKNEWCCSSYDSQGSRSECERSGKLINNYYVTVKDALIQDFTDIPITDIIWPIKANTDNQSNIFQYNWTSYSTPNEGLHGNI